METASRIGLSRHDLLRAQALIGGEWASADDGARLPVVDPATGHTLAHVPDCGPAETERAIAAAEAAFPTWRRTPAAERAHLLQRWCELVLAHAQDLASILTAEQGKPLAEAESEIRYAASFIEWFAGEAVRPGGYETSAPGDRRILVRKEPVGVCAAITPWNFPAAMVTRKAAPALAAGCTLVLKPSELTPFTALALGALAREAGVPAGVLNIVTGRPEPIGAALAGDPRVRKLSFTGSTRVGRLLMARCAPTVKRLSLELGGNAPFIVFDDADLDLALAGAMASKFRNAGQTCVCANRILVQAGIHDAFVARLADAVTRLRPGDGRDRGTTLGPLIDGRAAARVRAQVEDALNLGARLVATSPSSGLRGAFVPATLVTGASRAMKVAQEETFGPLAAVFQFETEDEATALANDTPYGLAAYVYTRDGARCWRASEALDYGMVGLNTGSVSLEMAPFGGVKQSGLGREGGREGLEEYLATKAVHWGGLS